MLYFLEQDRMYDTADYSNILEVTGREIEKYPDHVFLNQVDDCDIDLNRDQFYLDLCLEIDKSKLIARNVLEHIPSGEPHSIREASTGVMALWLLKNGVPGLWRESQWFGPNCYSRILEISKDQDIFILDNSDMIYRKEWTRLPDVPVKEFFTKMTAYPRECYIPHELLMDLDFKV